IFLSFGDPASFAARAKSAGVPVICQVQTLAHARSAVAAGADFIVAQGIEAGGHRGVFQPDGEDKKLKTLALIKMLTGSSKLPLVAAGGIMNRNQLFTMTQAGATAVQMGTAFLTCAESGAPREYKGMLLNQKTRPSLFTRAFSGRPARALENEFISLMQGQPLLPFPLQNTMTASIRKKAQKLENPEYQSLWAGENYRECRKESVAELIERMSL
ncbi:MAG: nitronate monooxygenase, partial [SAR324 cluster bacterium]|nr:nitronate monooxygenase [SAR324 cluster bacterium]